MITRVGANTSIRRLAAAISWSSAHERTHVLLLGYEPADLKFVESFMRYSKATMEHPLLVLALLADLQLKRYKLLHVESDKVLTLVLNDAGLESKKNTVTTAPYPDIDYDKLSRDALKSYRVAGNLSRSLLRFKKHVARISKAIAELGNQRDIKGKVVSLVRSKKSLEDYLEVTCEEIDDLVEKSRITANTASLLISAIANLVAQKETRVNQALTEESKNIAADSAKIALESAKMGAESVRIGRESAEVAKRSAEIAEATRADSAAMKVIAVMTMFFLPATFTSVSDISYVR
jgi:hypothetical protein